MNPKTIWGFIIVAGCDTYYIWNVKEIQNGFVHFFFSSIIFFLYRAINMNLLIFHISFVYSFIINFTRFMKRMVGLLYNVWRRKIMVIETMTGLDGGDKGLMGGGGGCPHSWQPCVYRLHGIQKTTKNSCHSDCCTFDYTPFFGLKKIIIQLWTRDIGKHQICKNRF